MSTSLASSWHWTQKVIRGLEWLLSGQEHLLCKREDLSLFRGSHTKPGCGHMWALSDNSVLSGAGREGFAETGRLLVFAGY